MRNISRITLITGMLMILIASMSVTALTVQQTVTVNIVSAILNVLSPVNGNIYQTNYIPLSFTVNTNNTIKEVYLTDNSKNTLLCLGSVCKNYNQIRFFSEGNHLLTVKVDFQNKNLSSIQQNLSFSVDSQSDVYINSSGILTKARAKDIVNYLFNIDFSLVHEDQFAPMDSCSVRGKNGNGIVNGKDFGNSNSINFYSVSSLPQMQGELSAQKGRERFSYKFRTGQIIENSNTALILDVIGTNGVNATVVFDKFSNKTSITSSNFSFENISVSFINGCLQTKKSFYLLVNNGRLPTSRSIDEVRQILNDNPIFLEKYPNLKYLFTSFWRVRNLLGFY